VLGTIGACSPNFRDLVRHAEIRTPWDIENEVGLTEGNIFQGELTLDQLLFNRPIPGYAQYARRCAACTCAARALIRAAASWAPRGQRGARDPP